MYNPYKQNIKLGFFFTLVYTSWNSYSLISTYLYQSKNLVSAAPINFITNFTAFVISSLLAPGCRLPYKYQMMMGSLGTGINVSSGLIIPLLASKQAAYICIGVTGAFSGLGSGLMWLGQGGYQRQVTQNIFNKGQYSGIFILVYSLATLFAGVIATIFFGYFSNTIFFIVLLGISFSSFLFALIFFHDIRQENQDNQEQNIVWWKDGFSLINTIKDTSLYSLKIIHLIPMLIIDGLIFGFYSSQLIHLIPYQSDKALMDQQASRMIFYIGIGALLGSYLGGITCDLIKLFRTGIIILISYAFCLILTLVAFQLQIYMVSCVVGLLWGFLYHFLQSWVYTSILKLYNGKLEAFSLNKVFHSLSFLLLQIAVLSTDNQINMKILTFCLFILVIPALWGICNQIEESQTTTQQSDNDSQLRSNNPYRQLIHQN